MSQSSVLLKHLTLISAVLVLLTACGGGDGGGSVPESDTTPPVINTIVPATGAADVNIFDPITITFNEDVKGITESNIRIFAFDSLDINTAKLITTREIPLKANSLQYDAASFTLSFAPDTGITPSINQDVYKIETHYQVTVTGVVDSKNNKLATDYSWHYTTTTIPTGVIFPSDRATNISRASDISITFSEPMNIDSNSADSIANNFSLINKGPLNGAAVPATIVSNVIFNYDPATNTATVSTPDLLLPENQYQVVLKTNAADLAGNSLSQALISNFSTGVTTTTTILATQPKQLSAIPHNGSVTLTWLAPEAVPATPDLVFTYNVYVVIDGGGTNNIIENLTTLNFEHTGIANNKNYRYSVSAVANNQESLPLLSPATVRPLDAPVFINSTVTTTAASNKVTINWSAINSTDIQFYNIYVTENGVTFDTPLNKNPLNVTTFVHSNNRANLAGTLPIIKNGNRYRYSIEAVNNNNDKSVVNITSSDSFPVAVQGAPLFTKQTAGVGSVSLAWTAIANLTYTLEVSTPGATPTPVTFSGSTYTKNGLTNGTTYTYKLTATNRNQLSVSTSISLTPLAKPTPSFTVANPGNNSVTLNWGELPDLTYKLEQKSPTTAYSIVVYNTLPLTIPKLTNGTTYNFKLTATNANGASTSIVSAVTPKLAKPAVPVLSISADTKQLILSWPQVTFAANYTLYIDNGDGTAFNPVPSATNTTSLTYSFNNISVHKYNWVNTKFALQACNTAGCSTDSNIVFANGVKVGAIGYFEGAGSGGVELSDNGQTAAIADWYYKRVGVYQYESTTGKWKSQTATPTRPFSLVGGYSISLSNDGNTLASSSKWSAIHIYKRTNNSWNEIQTAIPFTSDGKVVLSGDGNILAFGNNLWGINIYKFNGSQYVQLNNNVPTAARANIFTLNKTGQTLVISLPLFNDAGKTAAGAVYVLTRSTPLSTTWSPQVKLNTTVAISAGDNFGDSIAISDDGLTIAVGAPGDDAIQNDSGAVYLFKLVGTTWNQVKKIKNLQPQALANFGSSVALNNLGTILAAGAELDARVATSTGAAYLFEGASWLQSSYVKDTSIVTLAKRGARRFGNSVAINSDATVFAIGAYENANSLATQFRPGASFLY